MWERGFPTEVWVHHWPAFESQADAALAASPLTSLRVELPPEEVTAFADSPVIGRFRQVKIVATSPSFEFGETELAEYHPPPSFDDAALLRLAANPALAGVTELLLHEQPVGRVGLAALAESPHAAGLRRLGVTESQQVGGAVVVLADSPHFAGLEELTLVNSGLIDADLSALAQSPHLSRLTTLNLSSHFGVGRPNRFTSDGIVELAASRSLTGLRRLDLSGWRTLTAVQLQPLFDGPLAEQLTALNLTSQAFGDDGVAGLVRSTRLGRLGNAEAERLLPYVGRPRTVCRLATFASSPETGVARPPGAAVRVAAVGGVAALATGEVDPVVPPTGGSESGAMASLARSAGGNGVAIRSRTARGHAMRERDAFLASILAEPADTACRLVFADWLDEHGEPDRAAFVRSQCEAALSADVPRRDALLGEAARLLRNHRSAWQETLPQPAERAWGYGDWERGFPAEVWVEHWPAFERQADAVFAACPLTSLRVELPRSRRAFADSPVVGRFRRVKVQSPRSFDDAVLSRLMANSALAGVTELLLHEQPIGSIGLAALAASPHVVGLRRLGISESHQVGGAVAVLADSPHLAGLEELKIVNGGLTDADLSALARSPHLSRLTTLNISSHFGDGQPNRFDGDGISELAVSRNLTGLRRLDLSGCGALTAVQLESLCDSPLALRLNSLHLSAQRIGDAGAERLASLSRLESLVVEDCGITSIGVAALANGLPNLRHLTLSRNPIGDAGVIALANSPGLSALRELVLWGVGVSLPAFSQLVASPHLQQVGVIRWTTPSGSSRSLSPEQWRQTIHEK